MKLVSYLARVVRPAALFEDALLQRAMNVDAGDQIPLKWGDTGVPRSQETATPPKTAVGPYSPTVGSYRVVFLL